jgi:hypothetical protein
MRLESSGKALILIGAILVLIGTLLFFFGSKLHWIGNLPGDFYYEREQFRFYFPVTTLLILNSLLFLLLRLWSWLTSKK